MNWTFWLHNKLVNCPVHFFSPHSSILHLKNIASTAISHQCETYIIQRWHTHHSELDMPGVKYGRESRF